jgi:hypothetical protein
MGEEGRRPRRPRPPRCGGNRMVDRRRLGRRRAIRRGDAAPRRPRPDRAARGHRSPPDALPGVRARRRGMVAGPLCASGLVRAAGRLPPGRVRRARRGWQELPTGPATATPRPTCAAPAGSARARSVASHLNSSSSITTAPPGARTTSTGTTSAFCVSPSAWGCRRVTRVVRASSRRSGDVQARAAELGSGLALPHRLAGAVQLRVPRPALHLSLRVDVHQDLAVAAPAKLAH